MTDLGVPAGFNGSSYGLAINNKGEVVGQASTTGKLDACLYSNGTMTDLGGLLPEAEAKPTASTTTGWWWVSPGCRATITPSLQERADQGLEFLDRFRRRMDVGDADAVNDNGQMSDTAITTAIFAAFLVNTPLPSSLVLLAIGAASLFGYGPVAATDGGIGHPIEIQTRAVSFTGQLFVVFCRFLHNFHV